MKMSLFTRLETKYEAMIWQKNPELGLFDTLLVESNIHYPTNNSLVWDCIKESHRLLTHLAEEVSELTYQDYLKGAKKTYFKINNTKSGDKRVDLFCKQLILFTKVINNVSNAIKKNLKQV